MRLRMKAWASRGRCRCSPSTCPGEIIEHTTLRAKPVKEEVEAFFKFEEVTRYVRPVRLHRSRQRYLSLQ